ncbi:hypothetical protein, partial [Klebsiella variicola]|uniref:hypothetical protein n=1 Tax=Klebsiella variicola TaxID=244366 RepID=UPI00272EFBF9
GAGVFVTDKTRTRFEGDEPPLGGVADAEIRGTWQKLDELARQIDVEAPWAAPLAGLWDRTTISQWLDATVSSALARRYIDM